jgi:hypothetical protein
MTIPGDIGTIRAFLVEQIRVGLAGFWRVPIMTIE